LKNKIVAAKRKDRKQHTTQQPARKKPKPKDKDDSPRSPTSPRSLAAYPDRRHAICSACKVKRSDAIGASTSRPPPGPHKEIRRPRPPPPAGRKIAIGTAEKGTNREARGKRREEEQP